MFPFICLTWIPVEVSKPERSHGGKERGLQGKRTEHISERGGQEYWRGRDLNGGEAKDGGHERWNEES